MTDYEIQYVTVAGINIPAHKIICPECKKLVLGTQFSTRSVPWTALCPNGHEFPVDPREDA